MNKIAKSCICTVHTHTPALSLHSFGSTLRNFEEAENGRSKGEKGNFKHVKRVQREIILSKSGKSIEMLDPHTRAHFDQLSMCIYKAKRKKHTKNHMLVEANE